MLVLAERRPDGHRHHDELARAAYPGLSTGNAIGKNVYSFGLEATQRTRSMPNHDLE